MSTAYLLLRFVPIGPVWVLRDVDVAATPGPVVGPDTDELVVLAAEATGRTAEDARRELVALIATAPDLRRLCDSFDVRGRWGFAAASRTVRLAALSFLARQYAAWAPPRQRGDG